MPPESDGAFITAESMKWSLTCKKFGRCGGNVLKKPNDYCDWFLCCFRNAKKKTLLRNEAPLVFRVK